MIGIEPVHRWAYDDGEDPIEWAALLAALHIAARDEARAGTLTPGLPITSLDLGDMAVARRIIASLLNAGWTPPTTDTGTVCHFPQRSPKGPTHTEGDTT